MYISLNKKIFLSILFFFILSAGIFILILDNIIGKRITNDRATLSARNQYVIELLNQNISLRKKLNTTILDENPQFLEDISELQEALTQERQLSEELNQNYNENYETLKESLKIIGFSAFLMFSSLIILLLLLNRWIMHPIEKLILLSNEVANGNFTKRIPLKPKKFTDEFEILNKTVNQMLSNIEENITEIKEQELFLQNLIDAVPDGIRIIDNEHNIILSNQAYKEQIKKHILFNSTKCYQAYKKDTTCACNNTKYLCPLEKLRDNKTSNLQTIHNVNNHPLFINSAQTILNGKFCIIESIRDLSDNITYSHQQKIASLGLLSSSIAHEMKNNLGAINLILDGILQKHYSDESKSEEKQYLQMVSKQLKESIKVPERLLKLSRTTSAEDTIFNISTAILDILSLLDYEIKSRGINLIKNFSNLKENIKGNETDFKMIILNLVQNAIKAMPDGGNLEIKTNTTQKKIIIIIRDSGCGIKKEALDHIFEPFYSVSKEKGAGLGLAIVKNLINNLNAKISVESTENIGSTFKIEIPHDKQKKLL